MPTNAVLVVKEFMSGLQLIQHHDDNPSLCSTPANDHPFVPTCQSAERRAQALSRMPLAAPATAGAKRPGQREHGATIETQRRPQLATFATKGYQGQSPWLVSFNMAPQDHTKSDLRTKQEFLDNLAMILNSCRDYDSGHKFEAARIANCIFHVFVNANRRNLSLLARLARISHTYLVQRCWPAYGMQRCSTAYSSSEIAGDFEDSGRV